MSFTTTSGDQSLTDRPRLIRATGRVRSSDPTSAAREARVVPDSYDGYFTASTAAAGALIGLLFVAVALRPDSVFGAHASHTGRVRAGSAFTGLVNAFFISLIALIPDANLGYPAVVLGVSCLYW